MPPKLPHHLPHHLPCHLSTTPPTTPPSRRQLLHLVIYRLAAEPHARRREAGLVPGAVTETARSVEITLQRVAG